MLGRILACLAGLGICAATGYSIYWLIFVAILGGALEGNWLIVIAGGILTYLFIGLLAVGFVIGGAIFVMEAFDD